MEQIFNTVLATSIYAAIVGLAILLAKGVLKNKLNAKWHYIIWIVLILKLLIPFGPQSPFSLFNAVPKVSVANVQSVSNAIGNQYETYFEAASNQGTAAKTPGISIQSKTSGRGSLLPYIWFGGLGLMLLWLVFSYWLLFNKLQKEAEQPDYRLREILLKCMNRMGIKKDIPIVMQQTVSMPSLFGAFRPRILLSPQVLKLSDKELEYILLHELAHYKRKDIYMNYLLLAFQSVHWFNPVMWYCFKRLRQDMELAADEQVLLLLQYNEHKDYGKVLLEMLEKFTTPALAPKLLAMADNKRSIERRIKMMKVSHLFKGRRKYIIVLGILCIALLSSVLLTDGITKRGMTTRTETETAYSAEKLLKYKTAYVGDNSKVASILYNLPYGRDIKSISLQTKAEPYGITVEYSFNDADVQTSFIRDSDYILKNNAAVLFALVDNVEELVFQTVNGGKTLTYGYKRSAVQRSFGEDLRNYAKDESQFYFFVQSLFFKVHASPDRYSPAMSSTPGINLSVEYQGDIKIEKVRYTTQKGIMSTWEAPSGKIPEGTKQIEMPVGIGVFWSPYGDDSMLDVGQENIVTVELLDKQDKVIAVEQVTISNTEPLYYDVVPSLGVVTEAKVGMRRPKNIEEAVSLVIKSKADSYKEGEVATEGHIILEAKEEGPIIKVYAIVGIGNFGFENGVFTKISGSGAIPTVITLSNETANKYSLVDYQQPQDGAGYVESVKKLFPNSLQYKVLRNSVYGETLIKQQEAQAAEYLESIGRDAKVQAAYVEKAPVKINVEASNKLFAEAAKYDAFINSCPYWIGSMERLEAGNRYVYETTQGKTSDGYDLIVFSKKDTKGNVVTEVKYKIVGNEPQHVE